MRRGSRTLGNNVVQYLSRRREKTRADEKLKKRGQKAVAVEAAGKEKKMGTLGGSFKKDVRLVEPSYTFLRETTWTVKTPKKKTKKNEKESRTQLERERNKDVLIQKIKGIGSTTNVQKPPHRIGRQRRRNRLKRKSRKPTVSIREARPVNHHRTRPLHRRGRKGSPDSFSKRTSFTKGGTGKGCTGEENKCAGRLKKTERIEAVKAKRAGLGAGYRRAGGGHESYKKEGVAWGR